MSTTLADAAAAYLDVDLCPLPAITAEKRPALNSWKVYQTRRPTKDELATWFENGRATGLCLLTGKASGNLELLDFDHLAELYPAWRELVELETPGLADRLVRERSQSGGLHVIYRSEVPVPGAQKLAQRAIAAADDKLMAVNGKNYKPRRGGDHWEVLVTLIETRGEGGLFLCAPSPGYEIEHGTFEALPVLTAAERDILIDAARSLDELARKVEPVQQPAPGAGPRPGDDYNERGDVRTLLSKHGWRLVRPGENEYWARPGKDHGWSATLRGRVFYCFSSSGAPFAENHAYGPFGVYTLLEHGGDFGAAAAALRTEGYGPPDDAPAVEVEARADANPPIEALEALLANNRKFAATWTHKREDFVKPEQYDYALAAFAATVGWTNQQIADLVIAHRRKHNQPALDSKALARIVGQALYLTRQTRAILALSSAVTDTMERPEVMNKISDMLGIPVRRFLQHGRENSRYVLELADGRQVLIGGAEAILGVKRFRERLLDATGVIFPAVKQGAWDDVCRVLIGAVEVLENEETSTAWQGAAWVESYLEQQGTPRDEGDWKDRFKLGQAFVKDGALFLSAAAVGQHLRMSGGPRLSHPDLCEALRQAGFTRQTVSVRAEDKTATRSLWKRPQKQ